MRTIVYGLGAIGLLLFSALFSLLPRSWAHRVGRGLGDAAYVLSLRSRRTALENLRQRLKVPPAAARRIALRSIELAGASIVDMVRAPRMNDRVLERDLSIDDQSVLGELRRPERGAVVAIAHSGSWELLFLAGPFLARRKSLIVVRPPPYPFVPRVLRWLRSRTGQTVIHRSGAVGKALDFVKEGGVAWLMVDVNVPPQSALRVPFFGLPTCTTFAPAHIARTADVPLYFGCLMPERGSRCRLFLERIAPGDVEAMTEEVSRALERRIRGCPEGWAWWSKRWNIRPADVVEGWPSYSKDERRYLPGGKVRPDPEI